MKNRHIKLNFLLVVVLLLIEALFFLYYREPINTYVTKLIGNIRYSQKYEDIHKNKLGISMENLKKIPIDTLGWYEKYSIISHGGGGIDGKLYSESMEALNLSYSKGNRVYDLDLSETSDHHFVLCHSWSDNTEQTKCIISESIINEDKLGTKHYSLPNKAIKVPTLEEFLKTKAYGRYHRLTFKDLLVYMKDHKDMYVALDVQEKDMQKTYKRLLKIIVENGFSDLLNRFIVRFSNPMRYEELKKMGFENFAYKCYDIENKNYYEILKFVTDNNIPVVILPFDHLKDKGVILLAKHGVRLFFGLVDYLSDYNYVMRCGGKGVVSNYLYEKDI